MVRKIILGTALAGVLGVLLYTSGIQAPPTAQAAPTTQTFHIAGNSTGVSWDYQLQSCAPGCVVVSTKTVGLVVNGAPCADLVSAWVAKINEAPAAGFAAAIVGPAADCNFSVTFDPKFQLWIVTPSCKVTGNIGGCAFNPTVTQISCDGLSVGGVAEAPDVATLSAAASASGGIGYAPYAGGGAAAVVLLAAGVAGVWYLRRRQQA